MTAIFARLPLSAKLAIPGVAALIALSVALALPPIAQAPAYHVFADTRPWLGIGNFANVASNLFYLAAGIAGITFILPRTGKTPFAAPAEWLPWLIFFTGVILVAFGSAWYHHAPDNMNLVADRLAMSVTFMALFAGWVADRVDTRLGAFAVLPGMLVLGIASVLWWYATELSGSGDLRFYFLLNPVWPALTLPLLCGLFSGRMTQGRWLVVIALCYGVAIICEQADHEIFALTGSLVSGHTLKHAISALAVFSVLAMLHNASRRLTG